MNEIGQDKRIREFLVPERIVLAKGNVERPELLVGRQADQIGLNERELTSMRGRSLLLVDFGRELHGGIRLVVAHYKSGARVRLRVGESANEALADLGYKGCSNDHSLRDITLTLPFLSDMEFFSSGFRFASIEFLDEDAECTIKAINAVYVHHPRPKLGSFRCSDSLIERIYDTAAATVMLCAQNYIWDGIKRDRLVWMGDLYPEITSLLSVCADDGCVSSSLDFVVNETPLPGWMNGYPMYSMWWVMNLAEYYRMTGNREYVMKQREYFRGVLEQIDNCIAENGDFDFGMNFIDWPSHGHADEPEGVRCLCRLCARSAAELETLYGMEHTLSSRIAEKISRKSAEVTEKRQIAALKLLSCAALSAKERALLTENGAAGYSTFMSYFLLSAQSEAADMPSALAALKEYYGGMLKMGATSFWEDFDLDWMRGNVCPIDRVCREGEIDIHGDYGKFCYIGYRHSLCHGWSAGVIPFLVRRVLGVKVEEPGYTRVTVSPDLGDLEFAEGEIPTPHGILRISCRREKGKTVTEVSAPEGVRVEVR